MVKAGLSENRLGKKKFDYNDERLNFIPVPFYYDNRSVRIFPEHKNFTIDTSDTCVSI